MPASSGPLATLARLTLSTPAEGAAGASVVVSATLSTRSSTPRVVTTSATSALLIVRDGKILGVTHGEPGADVPVQLSAGTATPAQALPRSLRLTGCSSALASGRYELVAVLGYRLDSLNGAADGASGPPAAPGGTFVLVSGPATLTVS